MIGDIQQLRVLTAEAQRFAEAEGYVQSFVPRLTSDWQSEYDSLDRRFSALQQAYDQKAEQIEILRDVLNLLGHGNGGHGYPDDPQDASENMAHTAREALSATK